MPAWAFCSFYCLLSWLSGTSPGVTWWGFKWDPFTHRMYLILTSPWTFIDGYLYVSFLSVHAEQPSALSFPIKICLPILTTVLLLSLDGVTWQPKFSFQAHTLAHLTRSSHNLCMTSMYLSHAGFPSWDLSCLNNLIAAKGLSRHTLTV